MTVVDNDSSQSLLLMLALFQPVNDLVSGLVTFSLQHLSAVGVISSWLHLDKKLIWRSTSLLSISLHEQPP